MKLREGMRVLLVGAKCRYNLEHYTFSALKNLGCQVKFYGYYNGLGHWEDPVRILGTRSPQFRRFITPIALGRINRNLVTEAIRWKPDIILVIKGEIISPEALKKLKSLGCPLILWFPDDPRYTNSYIKHILHLYDDIFVVSKQTVKMYEKLGAKRAHYLPMGCDPSIHRRLDLTNEERLSLERDLCFIGTFSRHRAKVIKSLKKYRVGVWGSFWGFGLGIKDKHSSAYGPEMVKIYNSSKIALNIHDQTDYGIKTNMRLFESIGSGSFVLSDGENGLKDLFEPKKEIICYTDTNNLAELAEYYLAETSERRKIADLAYNRAHSEHTYNKRLQKLFQSI